MARASSGGRYAAFEPLYETDPRTGGTVEVFYAHRVLAESFGAGAGWFWWVWPTGGLPEGRPNGPFATSYRAYFEAMAGLRSRV
jgi:hypothetical protein